MSELKPCPFCGGEVDVIIASWTGWRYIGCQNPACNFKPSTIKLNSPKQQDGDSHTKAWNTRKPDAKKESPELLEVKELVGHCWVHSGYRNCGLKQMTSAQKYLFNEIIREVCKQSEGSE